VALLVPVEFVAVNKGEKVNIEHKYHCQLTTLFFHQLSSQSSLETAQGTPKIVANLDFSTWCR